MRCGLADAAPIEIAVERKHDAMGESIEAFWRDHAGLLQVWERVTQTHQPGAQTSTGRIADAQLLDQLRLAYAALIEVGNRFRMPM